MKTREKSKKEKEKRDRTERERWGREQEIKINLNRNNSMLLNFRKAKCNQNLGKPVDFKKMCTQIHKTSP